MPLPANLTQVAKNSYFTHFSANGHTFTHREFVQIWTVQKAPLTLQIHISGPFKRSVPSKNGPVEKNDTNYFAKKHLITTNTNAADMTAFKNKVHGVVDTRFDNTKSAAINDKRNKQVSVIAKAIGGTAKPEFRNEAKTVYASVGYGPGLDKAKVPSLTFVYCNMLTPDQLKGAFATALSAAKPAAFGEVKDIVVDFGTKCVIEVANDKSSQCEYEKIKVDAYYETVSATDIKVHVYHLANAL